MVVLMPGLSVRAAGASPAVLRSGRPPAAGGAQCVEQEAGDGHRPDAAWYRGDRPGDFTYRGKIHIADEAGSSFGIGGRADADIDDGRPRLDPVALDHPWLPCCGDHDVGAATDLASIAGF